MAQKPGSFVHIEIASANPSRTKKFLEDVFAWKFEDIPEMNYTMYDAGSGPGGGIMAPMEGQGPGILNYVLSNDIDGDIVKIENAGGSIVVPKMEIPNMGWWAGFKEPTGLMLALYQAKAAPRPRPRARPAARSRSRGSARKAKGKKGRGRRSR
jgi:uncharacterized protein